MDSQWTLKVSNPRQIWDNGNSAEYINARTHLISRFKQEGVYRYMNDEYYQECATLEEPDDLILVSEKVDRDQANVAE